MKIFLFITGLLVPAIMIAAGWLMRKHPPKNINLIVGYRTARSMRNMDTWLFAQKEAGRIWEKTGVILLIASAVMQIPFLFLSVNALSIVSVALMFVQLAALFYTIFLVERALKKAISGSKEIKS